MADYLLGIDVGNTGTKAVLVNAAGKVMASSTHEYPLHTPRPGWAEQDPTDWWKAAVTAIREVIAESEMKPEEVRQGRIGDRTCEGGAR
jgi:xylulokinase